MCDSFAALPPSTLKNNVIFGKSADCQVNEALALARFPAQSHIPGEVVKTTHIVIPQVAETCEVILAKSFWTWGAEIGLNEHGVAIGNEAVHTTLQREETKDGVMTIDMVRLGLERGRTAQEAIRAMTSVLEEFGQGGNCELSGNSHFDGSYIIADAQEAWILETAGREWVAKQITDGIGSISNYLLIGSDYDLSSFDQPIDWAATYTDHEIVPSLGSRARRACTFDSLAANRGQIDVKTAFDILRQHGADYHPAVGDVHTNICVHAGPAEHKQWQATGALVAEISDDGIIGWCTATAGTCISIFKPIFPGVELPEMGSLPTEHFNPQSLWWKHEQLHRRAMADFNNAVPEIRAEFAQLEAQFLAESTNIVKKSIAEKKAFMDDCFQRAAQATDLWIDKLSKRPLKFADATYGGMWQKFNQQAGLTNSPA